MILRLLLSSLGLALFSPQKLSSLPSDTTIQSIIVSDVIFYGFEDGNFTLPKFSPTGLSSQPFMTATDDLNNDGMLDITIANNDTDCVDILLQTC